MNIIRVIKDLLAQEEKSEQETIQKILDETDEIIVKMTGYTDNMLNQYLER